MLLFNNNKRAAEVAAQKLVCGLWYHVWCIGTEISILIEKMVSMRNKKSSILNRFSPLFSRRRCFLIIVSGRRKRWGKNWSVGCYIRCGTLALKTAISLKTRWAWELWKCKEEIDSHHSFGVACTVWWLHVYLFASVENIMVRGMLYQGGREVMICTPWLKIGLDVGVINADGPF